MTTVIVFMIDILKVKLGPFNICTKYDIHKKLQPLLIFKVLENCSLDSFFLCLLTQSFC